MKATLKRALALVGLAPARQVAREEAERRRAADRVRALEAQIAATRATLETWKHRSEEHAAAAAAWKRSASQTEEKARDDVARVKAHSRKLKSRVEALAAQVDDFQSRLEQAGDATAAARRELMVLETKLDLLEAAVNVLDARTRDGAVTG